MSAPGDAIRDAELMQVLKGVSRSFVLTIQALPAGLRRPIGIAYLLARASDTIADTAAAPMALRTECLSGFMSALLHERDALFTSVAGIHPANPAEQYLLANLRRVCASLDRLPPADRDKIIALLRKITTGQQLDLSRFPDPAQLHSLETAHDLDQYTYLVAGCVGEFWTRVCSAHLPRYSRIPLEDLCRLGRSFGQGLQLVNILRDVPEDLANGRCYLPMSELRSIGIASPEALRARLQSAAPVFETWRATALRHHEDARLYIQSIRPWRIRFACLVPWALGLRTLHLIGRQSPLDHRPRVKVSRKEVARVIRRSLLGAVSNRVIANWR